MSDTDADKAGAPETSFLGSIFRALWDGVKETLGWVLAGAVVGALALGGLGGYHFGWPGLGMGLVAGAVIGGILFLWFSAQV